MLTVDLWRDIQLLTKAGDWEGDVGQWWRLEKHQHNSGGWDRWRRDDPAKGAKTKEAEDPQMKELFKK